MSGSTGFGATLENTGRNQWGGAVLSDVVDGIQHIVDQGIADPSRVCIIGEGYGGYIALANAARSASAYACVASINGVSNLRDLYRYFIENYFDDSMNIAEFWERIGNPFALDLEKKSPQKLAKHILAPVILFHATDDSVVPRTQSADMSDALRKHNRGQMRVELQDTDHSLSSREARETLLDALESFLSRHLAARPTGN